MLKQFLACSLALLITVPLIGCSKSEAAESPEEKLELCLEENNFSFFEIGYYRVRVFKQYDGEMPLILEEFLKKGGLAAIRVYDLQRQTVAKEYGRIDLGRVSFGELSEPERKKLSIINNCLQSIGMTPAVPK